MSDLEELLQLLENNENKSSTTPAKKGRGRTNKSKRSQKLAVERFVKKFNIKKGLYKVPNYVLYYLYTTLDITGMSKQTFFKYFGSLFESARTGKQRYYLLNEDGIELTEDLLVRSKNHGRIYDKRKRATLSEKRKKPKE